MTGVLPVFINEVLFGKQPHPCIYMPSTASSVQQGQSGVVTETLRPTQSKKKTIPIWLFPEKLANQHCIG
jgi:hypothetical protein